MNVVAQVLAGVEGVLLLVVGVLGAFGYRNRRLSGFLLIEPDHVEAVRPWTVYAGFSNIVWGLGAIAGVVAVNLGFPEAGRALVMFVCIAMIVLALAVLFADIRFWRNVIGQAVLPVVIIVAMVV